MTSGDFACLSTNTNTHTGVNIGADLACACPTGYFSQVNGATACNAAQSGYFTVDSSGGAASTGAVGEQIVSQGYYACTDTDDDTDGTGVNELAAAQCLRPAGNIRGQVPRLVTQLQRVNIPSIRTMLQRIQLLLVSRQRMQGIIPWMCPMDLRTLGQ